jgi:hypothetical protein
MQEIVKALTKAEAKHQLRRLELRHNKISHVGALLLSGWMR